MCIRDRDHGKLEEVNTPAGLIDSLGNYTVDEFAGDETHSHYFHSREEAIAYLSGLSGQASPVSYTHLSPHTTTLPAKFTIFFRRKRSLKPVR